MRHISNLLGVTLLAGGLMLPQMAFANVATTIDSQFQDLRVAADQARSVARGIEQLSNGVSTSWGDMHRQIERIMPAQEALVEHLNILEAMEPSMSAGQCQALNEVEPAIQKISGQTEELSTMLDESGIVVQSPSFHFLAQQVAREASSVDDAAGVNAPGTSSY